MPNTPTGTFFDQIKSSSRVPTSLSNDPECLVRWLNSAVNFKITSKLFFFSQDSQDVITTELLYACCPYMGMQLKPNLVFHCFLTM